MNEHILIIVAAAGWTLVVLLAVALARIAAIADETASISDHHQPVDIDVRIDGRSITRGRGDEACR